MSTLQFQSTSSALAPALAVTLARSPSPSTNPRSEPDPFAEVWWGNDKVLKTKCLDNDPNPEWC